MNGIGEQSDQSASQQMVPFKRTNQAIRHRKISLPTELLQTIVEADVLSKRDILNARRVNKQWKKAVDHANLPSFQLPTTCLTNQRHRNWSTVAEFLRGKEESYARKMNRQVSRQIISIGDRSAVLMHDQTQAMLIGCGNGRLVQANLNSSSCIFSEIAKRGSITNGEQVRAARHLPHRQNLWRVVTQSAQNNDLFLYTFQGENQKRKILPRHILTDRRIPFTGSLFGVSFSSCGQYLVERCSDSITRYCLSDDGGAIDVEATLSGLDLTKTLCAQTGRRWELKVHERKVTVFCDSLSERVERQFYLQDQLKVKGDEARRLRLSVAPDGRRFAIWYLESDGFLPLSGHQPDTLSFCETYEVEDSSVGSLSPILSQTSLIGKEGSAETSLFPAWRTLGAGGWTFRGGELLCTEGLDRCFSSCVGIGLESSQKMTSLFYLPWWRSGTAHHSRLYFISSMSSGEETNKKLVVSKRQEFGVALDQCVVRLLPKAHLRGMLLCTALTVVANVGAWWQLQKQNYLTWGTMLAFGFGGDLGILIHWYRDRIESRNETSENEQDDVIAEYLQTTHLFPSR